MEHSSNGKRSSVNKANSCTVARNYRVVIIIADNCRGETLSSLYRDISIHLSFNMNYVSATSYKRALLRAFLSSLCHYIATAPLFSRYHNDIQMKIYIRRNFVGRKIQINVTQEEEGKEAKRSWPCFNAIVTRCPSSSSGINIFPPPRRFVRAIFKLKIFVAYSRAIEPTAPCPRYKLFTPIC